MLRAQEIRESWNTFFTEAAALGQEITATTAAKQANIRQSWNTFFTEAAQLGQDIRTTAAAKQLNIKQSWNTFFTEAAELGQDLKSTAAAKALNIKNSWMRFFEAAGEIADELRATTANVLSKTRLRQARDLAAYQAATAGPPENYGYGGQRLAIRPAGFTDQDVRIKNLLDDQAKGIRINNALKMKLDTIANQHEIELLQRNIKLELDANDKILKARIAADEKFWAQHAARLKQQPAPTTRGREAVSNAIIGGAFPLLFGQGLGGAAGGAAGGAVGGFMGGSLGFGLSLVGTALGAQFDATVQKARDFATALREGGDAAGFLKENLGNVDPEILRHIKNLQEAGQTADAARLSMKVLAGQIGTENANALRKFGEDANAAFTGFNRLLLTTQASVIRLITSFSELGNNNGFINFLKFAATRVAGPVTSLAADVTAAGSMLGATGRQPTSRATTATATAQTQLDKLQETSLKTQLDLTRYSASTNLQQYETKQKQLATDEKAIKQQQLILQYGIRWREIGKAVAENKRIELEYQIKLGTIAREVTNELERQRKNEAQKREEAARKAKQAAEEQLRNETNVLNAVVQVNQAYINRVGKAVEFLKLSRGEAQSLELRSKYLASIEASQKESLDIEEKIQIKNAKTAEELNAIKVLYEERRTALTNEIGIARTQLYLDKTRYDYNLKISEIQDSAAKNQTEFNAALEAATIKAEMFGTVGNIAARDRMQNLRSELEYQQKLNQLAQRKSELDAEAARQAQLSATGITDPVESDKLNRAYKLLETDKARIENIRILQVEQQRLNQFTEKYGGIFDTISTGLTGMFDLLITGSENWGNSLRQIAATVLQDIARQLLRIYVIEQLIGVIKNAFAPKGAGASGFDYNAAIGRALASANGNAFAANGIIPYARGGIVDSPTFFKFAKGGAMATGVMGEAGPEAVLPLRRGPDGRLGVSSNGTGDNITVNVVVNSDGSTSAQGNDQQALQLGRLVGAQVRQTIIEEKRPGGLLASTR